MKSLCYAVLFTMLYSISIPLIAQDSSSVETFEVLDISGVISFEDKGLEEVKVELFEGNTIVDAFETKKNGKFKFTLYSSRIYTIQLSKSGYYTKRISVNTNVPTDYQDVGKFQFDIGMTSKTDAEYDPYLSEYPSALIAFDEKKREFNYDKQYTKSYFDEIEAQK